MTLPASKFELEDRGSQDYLVLIPGWASDHRIFSSLNLPYNYIQAIEFSPLDFTQRLAEFLTENYIVKVSLFGWSLGGFIAAEFAAKNPDWVNELFLLGIRERYEKEALKKIKEQLNQNSQAYLYKFYPAWFSMHEKNEWGWFKKNLFKVYLEEMRQDSLFAGLDYLAQARFDLAGLAKIEKIKIFQGKEDKIAHFEEAANIAKALPQAKFVPFEQGGHALFLRQDFYQGKF